MSTESQMNDNRKEYRVCGKIVMVTAALTAIAGVAGVIVLLADYLPVYGVVLCVLGALIFAAIIGFMGILLAKNIIQVKGVYILYTVIAFLFALGWIGVLLGLSMVGMLLAKYMVIVVVLLALCIPVVLAIILWNGSVGILLMLKNSPEEADEPAKEGDQKSISDTGNYERGVRTNQRVPEDFSEEPEYIGEIEGIVGAYSGRRTKLRRGEICYVGRAEGSQVLISHPKVSRHHCTIRRLSGKEGYLVTDTSTNGTFYRNVRLEKDLEYEVPAGSSLIIGDEENILQLR